MTRRFGVLAGGIVTVMLLLTPITGWADQDAPELDRLFRQLRQTGDPVVGGRITTHIWRLWRETDDAELARTMKQGMAALQAQDLAGAEQRFTRIVERWPDFAEGWNKRATVRYLREEWAPAAADVRRALALEPRHFGALAGLGLVYMELERYRAAISAFQRALAINPYLEGTRQNIEIARQRLRASRS